MRTTADRIRHTVLFEILGLGISAPLASWILEKGILHVGTISVVLSLVAMLLNYVFNLIFDKALLYLGRPVHVRSLWMRVVHAVLFECSLIILTIPVVAWWLDMGILEAFFVDLGFTLFFLVYAFVYNWGYDIVFPMPIDNTYAKGKVDPLT